MMVMITVKCQLQVVSLVCRRRPASQCLGLGASGGTGADSERQMTSSHVTQMTLADDPHQHQQQQQQVRRDVTLHDVIRRDVTSNDVT